MAARHGEGRRDKIQSAYIFLLERTIERSRHGGTGHRVSGDTAGRSWFRNRRFRYRNVGGATVEPLGGGTPPFLVRCVGGEAPHPTKKMFSQIRFVQADER